MADMIQQAQFSELALLITPVSKNDGSLCICGGYKLTINQAAAPYTQMLLKVDDLLATLSRNETYTKPDLPHAY